MSIQQNNLPPGYDDEDIRLTLYDQYSTPEQSLEDFCHACADHLGPDWINLLSRAK